MCLICPQDAGQKQFGAIQCEVCSMVYTPGDPTDDTTHSKFHESLLTALRFPVRTACWGSHISDKSVCSMYASKRSSHGSFEEIHLKKSCNFV